MTRLASGDGMNKRAIIGIFIGSAAGIFAAAVPANAQTYVCPGGPGPGEVQVGIGRGPGDAGAPLCAPDANAAYGGDQSADDIAASFRPSPDPMARRLQLAIEMEKMALAGKIREIELQKDPRYQRYINGGWDFFQDAANARPGEMCTAFFTRKESHVAVTGPGGGFTTAFLTFWGPGVPKPKDVKRVKVTLMQTGDEAPQTVTAFNSFNPASGMGGITLAVPTASALLDNMLDVHRFALSMDGKQVTEVEWTGGLAARDTLKACIAKGGRG